MSELPQEDTRMKKPKPEKTGIAFVVFSFVLAFAVMSAWVILGPILPTTVTVIEATNFIVFAFGCVGMVVGVLGFRYIKRTGISWSTATLSIVSFLANGTLLFFATLGLIHGAPEVKGVLVSVGDDFVTIYVDESYRSEYNTNGSQLSSLYSSSSVSTNLPFPAGISSRTIFYEQYGKWAWQKKVVSRQSLEEGLHIQIKYNGWMFLDGSIVEAEEIIILRKW